MEGSFYAGWDGGGTATTIECIDEEGKIVLREKTGPLNVHGNTPKQVRQSIQTALAHMDTLPGGLGAFKGLCVGGAGISGAETRAIWTDALESGGYRGPCRLVSDFETALYGAFETEPGIVIISGTGAVCCGMNSAGKFHRSGGWGHIFDDEGSGYAIGRDTLSAAVRSHDGRAIPTILTDLVLEAWNVPDIPELISKAYSQNTGKKDIAALAALCNKALMYKDKAAEEIFEKAAKSLAEMLVATKLALELEMAETALLGGLLKNETPLRAILENHMAKLGCFLVRAPMADAARGAALMARQKYEEHELVETINITALDTEKRNQNTFEIDKLDTLEMLQLINHEDKQVALCIEEVLPSVALAVDIISSKLSKSGRLIYCGAGTSGRLGVLDASECPPTFNVGYDKVMALIAGGKEAFIKAREGAEDNEAQGAEDLRAIDFSNMDVLVGIAASGRTPYVVGALKYAKTLDAPAIALSCVRNAAISAYADISINPVPGPEVITGSTRMKSGTAQKMILNMLSTAAMIKLGKTYGNLMVDVKATNQKLVERVKHIVCTATGVSNEEAALTLEKCGFSAKNAILMILADIDYQTSKEALNQAEGKIHFALKHLGK